MLDGEGKRHSGRATCGDGAGCSAIYFQSLCWMVGGWWVVDGGCLVLGRGSGVVAVALEVVGG